MIGLRYEIRYFTPECGFQQLFVQDYFVNLLQIRQSEVIRHQV
jgi:hypothetical protein